MMGWTTDRIISASAKHGQLKTYKIILIKIALTKTYTYILYNNIYILYVYIIYNIIII